MLLSSIKLIYIVLLYPSCYYKVLEQHLVNIGILKTKFCAYTDKRFWKDVQKIGPLAIMIPHEPTEQLAADSHKQGQFMMLHIASKIGIFVKDKVVFILIVQR